MGNQCVNCFTDLENGMCSKCGSLYCDYKAEPHHLQPGTILNGKYVIGRVLGEGGFGITYIGKDINLNLCIAIKEYYPSGIVNRNNTCSAEISTPVGETKNSFEKGKSSFLQEARTLAQFSSEPSIVSVRDFFSENNTAYIVMEYLEGIDLKEYLKNNGVMSFTTVYSMLSPIMIALGKIHEHGLIHRDISPANIMILNNGTAKLLDFGAARNVGGLDEKSLSIMLKPGFAPEEQYRSKGHQGPWTDIYALCATMYKCITGITPVDSIQRVFNDELIAPSDLGISINKSFENVLMKGLSVSQGGRYQSIDELLVAFKAIDFNEETNTIGQSVTVIEDNTETRCIENIEITHSDVTLAKGENIFRDNTQNNDSDNNDSLDLVSPEKSVSKPSTDASENNVKNEKNKKKKSKKKFGIIILVAAIAIVAIIGISAVFKSLNTIIIAGEKVSKSSDSLTVSDVNVTIDDMNAILSLGKLERLSFNRCKIDNDTVEKVGDISTYLKNISFESCTGFDDFSFLSNLKYLTDFDISDCNLTNEQLNSIDFSNKDYLTSVVLENNEKLSDISTLSKLKNTLMSLDVDKTKVVDFSSLKDCKVLTNISACEVGLTTLDTIKNETITQLCVSGNQISDITQVKNYEYLGHIEADNNQIADISSLADHKALYHVQLSNNKISDISAFANCEYLGWLEINDNNISSLKPLEKCKKLSYLYIRNNNLSDLFGLENALELKVIKALGNHISDINGLVNATILETVDLDQNNVSDISVLSKSKATLEALYFSDNNVSDISALKGTSKLEYITFNNNKVSSLDALSDSVSLLSIEAENNQITSIDGLSNSVKLKYIYLPRNQIESMQAIENLVPRTDNDFAIIDLSTNKIKSFCLTTEKTYSYLAVYNNPIESYAGIESLNGGYFIFSYVEGMDVSVMKDTFNHFRIVGCPKDKQVSVKRSIDGEWGNKVSFSTIEETDKDIKNIKDKVSPF